MFRFLNPRVQAFGGVVVEHRDGLLGDNRTRVNAEIDQVNGAAGYFDSVPALASTLPDPERRATAGWILTTRCSNARRKSPLRMRMNPGQNDQLDFGFTQRSDKTLLGRFVEFGSGLPGSMN